VDLHVVVVGAENDVGDVLEADERAPLLLDDELLEFVDRVEIGRRGEVRLDELVLGLADCGQVVVGGERLSYLRWAYVERRYAVRFEPGADRERAASQDVGLLYAGDGGEARLYDADEVVGDLIFLEDGRAEAQVHRGEHRIGRFDVDGRD